MEPLEVVLRKVEDLRSDLSAEIVHQEEEGHYEAVDPRYGYNQEFARRGLKKERWVLDKARIAEPDTKKREVAKVELQKVYDSSEWYSARYTAGVALKVNTEELDEQIRSWLRDLERKLEAEVVVDTYIDHYRTSGGPSTHEQDFYDDVEVKKPDVPTRIAAVQDLGNLFKLSNSDSVKSLLQQTYHFNTRYNVRKQAGKYLGKSTLGIWFRQLRR